MRLLFLAMLYALIPLSAFSATADCNGIVKSQFPKAMLDDREICYCGPQLTNLTVTLPRGLRVEAVCGLRFVTSSGSHNIDLSREKLTLDSYRQGDYPKGHIFLSGVIQEPIIGTVRFDEGPAGTLWFNASSINRRGPVFWEHHLKSLSLGTELDFKKLRATTLKEGQCWEAEATIKIRNPSVLLGDTDEAGTGADIDVIRVADYKPCKEREDPIRRLTKGQQQDVVAVITRIVGCNYYQGDWPYAEEEEKAQYTAELAKLNCTALPKDEEQIKSKYSGNDNVIQVIDAAKSVGH